MKYLFKYKWVKLRREFLPSGKGIMGYWARLAARVAFRKGNAFYCGHTNEVEVGEWVGGIVGLKSILGVSSRQKAIEIMEKLSELGYIEYELDVETRKLSYKILDKVKIKIDSFGKKVILKLRKPEWCDQRFENEKDGYLIFEGVFANDEISIDFDMKLKKVYPNGKIHECVGKVSLSYGPIVLCAEGIDNHFTLGGAIIGALDGATVNSDPNDAFAVRVQLPVRIAQEQRGLYFYSKPTYKKGVLRMIPYFAWANRGTTEMKVFFANENEG